MPYRVPGAYARFIQRPSAVNNVGATRALGLIGTGANYFEVYNEAIKKSSTQSYDNLKQKNVFEIISVNWCYKEIGVFCFCNIHIGSTI